MTWVWLVGGLLVLVAAMLVAPLLWLGKGTIGRPSGALFVLIYLAYVGLVVVNG